ncbi:MULTISPECIES: hypothetical protein [Streptomycetaceae]|uniref:C1q domain-containing protein n=1 Tax=Streptantibioticus cattleyicolor (strain ATCC 35852 / DSM 46488 / JCM 4925 / NBRC 14057 / NRRL 8057) TaxID=1003195 RepID=F8JS18_STREN|nr:hypothetical protein [Streptantibioticus cattleyicolor]AEW92927.1 hypothetical protein SCATT_05560 [Streptantibioticus cattleyicolor NRRL 8057 = DSM 46488]MYS57675.1 hypothetical protein [Streptomyces sp. SID5468]CCB73287.1 protein of unknown function [Streptantibioticus cattleyicolor NRRL 8057 = DSM 46488]
MGLAPPVIATQAPGNFITGALWNSQVANGLTFLLGPPVFVGVQGAATQSLANTATTAINLDTNVIDFYGGHSTSFSTSRYVCQQPGYYTVSGTVVYTANATGMRGAHACVNGASNPIQGCAAQVPAGPTYNTAVALPARDVYLNQGDYVEIYGWQSSGGTLSTQYAADQASMLYLRFSHS